MYLPRKASAVCAAGFLALSLSACSATVNDEGVDVDVSNPPSVNLPSINPPDIDVNDGDGQ